MPAGMWEIISEAVARRGQCAVVLTTHSMEECEALCNRYAVWGGLGRERAEGTPSKGTQMTASASFSYPYSAYPLSFPA